MKSKETRFRAAQQDVGWDAVSDENADADSDETSRWWARVFVRDRFPCGGRMSRDAGTWQRSVMELLGRARTLLASDRRRRVQIALFDAFCRREDRTLALEELVESSIFTFRPAAPVPRRIASVERRLRELRKSLKRISHQLSDQGRVLLVPSFDAGLMKQYFLAADPHSEPPADARPDAAVAVRSAVAGLSDLIWQDGWWRPSGLSLLVVAHAMAAQIADRLQAFMRTGRG